MNTDILNIIKIICFVLAGLFLLISIFMFFHYDIINVYNFLTGKTASREIDEIRTQKHSFNKKSSINFTRTDEKNKTEKIEINLKQTTLLNNEMTTIIGESETTVLNCSDTQDLDNVDVDEDIEFILRENIMIVHSDRII